MALAGLYRLFEIRGPGSKSYVSSGGRTRSSLLPVICSALNETARAGNTALVIQFGVPVMDGPTLSLVDTMVSCSPARLSCE